MKRVLRNGACIVLMICLSFAAGRFTRVPERKAANVKTVAAQAEVDPIDAFRTEREQLRQMQAAQIDELIHSENADSEVIRMAQACLLERLDDQEKETTIEGVLRARGFKDAIATVHRDSVNILVRAESLSRQETAAILELVMRETGISGGNVKIIPIN